MILPDDLLSAALPGREIPQKQRRAAWKELVEQPWKRWRTGSTDWAIYLIVGNRLSETAITSIRKAKASGLRPVVVASDNSALQVVAPHFGTAQCHVVCQIAGKGHLISPLTGRSAKPGKQKKATTRIPPGILKEVAAGSLPVYLRRILTTLRRGYEQVRRSGKLSDDSEHDLLRGFAVSILRHMGFRSANIDAPSMIRRLEASGWGGRRDHFFHSFQNYFFGLFAVVNLPSHFNAYRVIAKLNWEVDPFDVWFLTALWHDVGYGVERSGAVIEDMAGDVFDEDLGEYTRVSFLRSRIIQEALKDISCLMVRLLEPSRARTGWMLPPPGRRRTTFEKNIQNALETNVLQKSHGAASSLRLYAEYIPRINRMSAENQQLPKQAVLLACCSAPFHDWHFRECIRSACGSCGIGTDSMPFAGLLAFVDSIQDDRRDLDGLREELSFLERLVVRPPATVSAQVNKNAVPKESVLWKIVEARDVFASLRQNNDGLCFIYPDWMVK